MNLDYRIFFRLKGPLLAAANAHRAARKAAISNADAFCAELTGCKAARAGFVNGRCESVFLPAKFAADPAKYLPGSENCAENWAKYWQIICSPEDGKYFKPRRNSAIAKQLGKQLEEHRCPLTWDFLKAQAPEVNATCFLGGRFMISAVMIRLGGRTVLVLPDCERNRKAQMPPGAVPAKNGDVPRSSEPKTS